MFVLVLISIVCDGALMDVISTAEESVQWHVCYLYVCLLGLCSLICFRLVLDL